MEIAPRPGGGLTHARARHRTPYGMAECVWKIEDGNFHLDAIIPPNTTARVMLPGNDTPPIEIGSGFWHWTAPYQDPDARAPFTLDDLTGDILSDPAAGDAIRNILTRIGAPDFAVAMIFNERNMPLRQALRALPHDEEVAKMIGEALTCKIPIAK